MANWIAKAQEKAHYKAMEKAIKATQHVYTGLDVSTPPEVVGVYTGHMSSKGPNVQTIKKPWYEPGGGGDWKNQFKDKIPIDESAYFSLKKTEATLVYMNGVLLNHTHDYDILNGKVIFKLELKPGDKLTIHHGDYGHDYAVDAPVTNLTLAIPGWTDKPPFHFNVHDIKAADYGKLEQKTIGEIAKAMAHGKNYGMGTDKLQELMDEKALILGANVGPEKAKEILTSDAIKEMADKFKSNAITNLTAPEESDMVKASYATGGTISTIDIHEEIEKVVEAKVKAYVEAHTLPNTDIAEAFNIFAKHGINVCSVKTEQKPSTAPVVEIVFELMHAADDTIADFVAWASKAKAGNEGLF